MTLHCLYLKQIVIIEHKSIICPGYGAVLHIHTCIEEVQITVIVLSRMIVLKYFILLSNICL